MNCPDYNSSAELKQILEQNNFSMQKKFGQNFLINGNARKKIADALEIGDGSFVWEVGPGLGAMTAEILRRGAKLTVFEIDRGFIQLLRSFFSEELEAGQLKIVEGDVLKSWRKELKEGGMPQRFFGNLPYNIAAALIADTIEASARFDRCVFTVQKEVAARMRAGPSTEDYSSFSVLCQWAYKIEPIMELSGANFWPKPRVASQSVVFTPRSDFPACREPENFMRLQRALFSSRRKTVRNNLSVFLKSNELALSVLADAGIDSMKRAEVLSIQELQRLSDSVTAMKEKGREQ